MCDEVPVVINPLARIRCSCCARSSLAVHREPQLQTTGVKSRVVVLSYLISSPEVRSRMFRTVTVDIAKDAVFSNSLALHFV
jgi:hypothetical protein